MTQDGVPAEIIERLRINLNLARITLNEADVQGMVDKGFLSTVLAFEDYASANTFEDLPDYLKDWGESAPLNPAAGAGGAPLKPFEVSRNAPENVKRGGPGWEKQYGTLAGVAAQIRASEVSPVELTKQALERIASQDGELNSFQLVLAEQAMAAARQAEQEIQAGQYRGPLHGVPVAVKDLLAMRGTITTAGSKIRANDRTDFDATAVTRLHAAGAVIVGKTRMSEFAYSPGSNNAHYGPTRNPANPAYDTGGSSSGSGAAVAAGMAYGSLGTDTGGSIRVPAALCGLVGLKPTFGRLSLYGAVNLSWSLDHVGPMTRTVEDNAIMLQALEGFDARDMRSRLVPPVAADLHKGVRGLRVGVLAGADSLATPEVIEAWHIGLAELEKAGATLYEVDLPEFGLLRNLSGALLGLETSAFHQHNLSTRLEDYGEFMRQRVLAAYAYSPNALVLVQQARQLLRRRFEALFQEIDLFSTPPVPHKAPLLGIPTPVTLTAPFNFLGWPAISVPVARSVEGLPLGIQLAGKAWDEATVLRAAQVIETGLSADSGS
ncbi:MAG: Amidase [Chloroflexi bacterium]|jgi:aspartyl-tRNA(Asn)/glutamyl-tRNA(Gln) amidotransferase subunit A|nr:Amidase [Chloroflexota bacterium]